VGVILLAAAGFYFGRRVYRRRRGTVVKESTAERGQDGNGVGDNDGAIKGIAELSSPLVSPVGGQQEMAKAFGQVHEMDSGYPVPQGHSRLSELHSDEKGPVELPGDSMVYEK